MQTFFAYHFLQSLAFALLSSLWQMALLWIVYNIFIALFSVKPTTHFKFLVGIQATGFVWFVYTLVKQASKPIVGETKRMISSVIGEIG